MLSPAPYFLRVAGRPLSLEAAKFNLASVSFAGFEKTLFAASARGETLTLENKGSIRPPMAAGRSCRRCSLKKTPREA